MGAGCFIQPGSYKKDSYLTKSKQKQGGYDKYSTMECKNQIRRLKVHLHGLFCNNLVNFQELILEN